MSTFFAAFKDPARAERVVSSLLDQGVQPDDVSILTHESKSQAQAGLGIPSQERQTVLTDATDVVGRSDDPPPMPEQGDPAAHDYLQASRIGYAAASSSPNDDVSDIEETDDSSAEAEDELDPPEEKSYSAHETDDLESTLSTNFPTSVPVIDDFQPDPRPDTIDLARSLETITVPHFGLVLGGGSMATAVIEKDGGDSRLKDFLIEEGMSNEEADSLIDQFKQGGTILAIELEADLDPQYLENLATCNNAEVAVTIGAPRY